MGDGHCVVHNARGTNAICRVTADSQSIRARDAPTTGACASAMHAGRLPDYACTGIPIIPHGGGGGGGRKPTSSRFNYADRTVVSVGVGVELILEFIHAYSRVIRYSANRPICTGSSFPIADRPPAYTILYIYV